MLRKMTSTDPLMRTLFSGSSLTAAMGEGGVPRGGAACQVASAKGSPLVKQTRDANPELKWGPPRETLAEQVNLGGISPLGRARGVRRGAGLDYLRAVAGHNNAQYALAPTELTRSGGRGSSRPRFP